jgi:uncharacterized membrane protein
MQPQTQAPMWRCPFCGCATPPIEDEKISTGGWVMFVALLFLCFVLCWIPLLAMKESQRRCRNCMSKVG